MTYLNKVYFRSKGLKGLQNIKDKYFEFHFSLIPYGFMIVEDSDDDN